MFKHVVCHKYETTEQAAKAAALLRALPAQIPVLLSMEVGLNKIETPRSYDLVLIATFQSEDDLPTYSNHPAHVAVRNTIKPWQTASVSVDYLS